MITSLHVGVVQVRFAAPLLSQDALIGIVGMGRLNLIAEGKTNKEIAHLLDISIKTVDTHRTQLMDRLDIHDIAGLVRFAIKHRIIST